MHLSSLKWITMVAIASAMTGARLTAVMPGVMAAADEPARAEAERKKLQGTWIAHSVTESGQVQETTGEHRMKFEGDVIAVMEGDEVHARGPFTLDPSKNPLEMTIVFQEGKMQGKTGRAILAWDGMDLKFCGAIEPNERPTEFRSNPGDGRLLVLLKRQAP